MDVRIREPATLLAGQLLAAQSKPLAVTPANDPLDYYCALHLIDCNVPTLKRMQQVRRIFYNSNSKNNKLKPTSSEVLTSYLRQCNEPPWTSYFIKYSSIREDQWGKSHFNWNVGQSNYHILRTGCFPYIKYHCTKRAAQNLTLDDYFFRCIKVINLGIPCLAYGIAATFLIKHIEYVNTTKGTVKIYFLYPEDKGSIY
ncbi:hypothetical protein NQ318_001211 [Aromia moschata]|uniref:Uncharacterized protein n=1 Tax=Aromia moschata TaxID=1265417 RepID=A0AAV8ZHF1_9CUCU|nr:hypothetical protein NQ318_001211 [Aromia moschata]